MSGFKAVPAFIFLFLLTVQLKGADSLQCREPFHLSKILPQNNNDVKKTNYITDRWIAPDKGLHLIGSMIHTVGISKSGQRFGKMSRGKSRNFGAGITVCLGFGKEMWDFKQPGNKFSVKDLAADLAGVALGILLLSID